MQELRWTSPPADGDARALCRERTCSWLELGLIVYLLSRGNGMPHDVTFAMYAAMMRNLWVTLTKFEGGAKLIKKVRTELPRAGAAATCGIPNLMGLSRCPFTGDYPALAVNVASLLKLAASSTDKVDTAVPLSNCLRQAPPPCRVRLFRINAPALAIWCWIIFMIGLFYNASKRRVGHFKG